MYNFYLEVGMKCVEVEVTDEEGKWKKSADRAWMSRPPLDKRRDAVGRLSRAELEELVLKSVDNIADFQRHPRV